MSDLKIDTFNAFKYSINKRETSYYGDDVVTYSVELSIPFNKLPITTNISCIFVNTVGEKEIVERYIAENNSLPINAYHGEFLNDKGLGSRYLVISLDLKCLPDLMERKGYFNTEIYTGYIGLKHFVLRLDRDSIEKDLLFTKLPDDSRNPLWDRKFDVVVNELLKTIENIITEYKGIYDISREHDHLRNPEEIVISAAEYRKYIKEEENTFVPESMKSTSSHKVSRRKQED